MMRLVRETVAVTKGAEGPKRIELDGHEYTRTRLGVFSRQGANPFMKRGNEEGSAGMSPLDELRVPTSDRNSRLGLALRCSVGG